MRSFARHLVLLLSAFAVSASVAGEPTPPCACAEKKEVCGQPPCTCAGPVAEGAMCPVHRPKPAPVPAPPSPPEKKPAPQP